MGAYDHNPERGRTVTIYPTMQTMLDELRKLPQYHMSGHSAFEGSVNTEKACDFVERGASEYQCAKTRELLAKINDRVHHRERMQNIATPAGSRVVVPEVLAGAPYSMRRRKPVQNDLAPVRIVCEVLVSAGVSLYQLERRGAAIAALAMRLSETRPVELWAAWAGRARDYGGYGKGQESIGRVKLDNNPLTIAEVVAVMATPQFARNICYAESKRVGDATSDHPAWAWAVGTPGGTGRDNKVRELLGLEAQDIFIPGGFISEATAFMRDPVAWVESYVESQRETEKDE